MSLSILQSIRPKYCELIASGKKTIEIRKTKPRIPTPFKVYIYETKTGYVSRSYENDILVPVKYGKVIGEYVCEEISEHNWMSYRGDYGTDEHFNSKLCLNRMDLYTYGKGKTLYGYHISNLKIYDQPKELSEFYKLCTFKQCNNCKYKSFDYEPCGSGKEMICTVSGKIPLTRAPQSWCHVETI